MHLYADNIQLYMFLPTNSSPGFNKQLSNSNNIKEWLISNNLLLNTSKTTLLNLIPSPIYFPPFIIDKIVISTSPTASNLDETYFLIILFPSFLILLQLLNLQIIIYLELDKYENQLLY